MRLENSYGIDLGTGMVKIYDQKADHITQESTMIALRNGNQVFAVGNDAFSMFEKAPADVRIIRPVSNGRINDILMTEAVLHTLLRRNTTYTGSRPTLYFSVPMDLTEIEKRAYASIAQRGRLRRSRIFLVEKPIADAIAVGVPLHHTKGTMIINLGAQSTELSVLADERVIINRLVPIGGMQFDQAVREGVLHKNNFLISSRTAQRLKFVLTDFRQEPSEGRKVYGLDRSSGLPRDGIVSAHTVTRMVRHECLLLADEIRKFIDRIPPQVQESIRRDGIILTGGSARIPGIDQYFRGQLEYPVRISQYYGMSTIQGIRILIRRPEMRHWAIAPSRNMV
ncbi:MAG: rod shape-determining protein [Lachnospiraceae bacterium]|jgi:rod shape-determining protein MreB|nr:rod shape-determining protein [Eubacterium sp.]MCI6794456.1 rod shape-determining protein [Lachnospiraceae bacterium]MDD6684200.1 rod shape-determining protein [Lachnospiraceae bacterium]MDD7048530.1 rod shape-determining protein [Lachnospiraceae bacterium]HBB60618.1 rod shape-determining protein [Lachnospiraceae bacterium]